MNTSQAGVAQSVERLFCQEVTRRCTRSESEEYVVHRQQSTQVRESILALKPRADIT